MKFTDWLKESYIQFYNKRYIQIPIIQNNDKNEINEILKYLKIIIDQGFTKINISTRDKNRKFLGKLNIKRTSNEAFLPNHFLSYVLKCLIVDDFYDMSYDNNSVAYVFRIENYDKRLNISLVNINKKYLYIKFSFVCKLSKHDKELLKIDKNVKPINGITISPDNYNLVFLDTEKTIIDIISIHDSTK